tara:strand:- start:412 stop:621 length:210 start_codon:yes stop_codon:yes gene_type:complete
LIKKGETMSKDKWMVNDCILVPYPDEDLFEDGELDESTTKMVAITPVQEKILWLTSTGRAVLATWEDLK